MNHCYRLVFNRSTQVWQVVSEIAKSHSKSVAIVLLPLLSLVSQSVTWAEPAANALPSGGQVVAGQSAITQKGNKLNIVQSTEKSIINWQNYNIGINAEVNYIQNSTSAISVNRVVTGDPSAIFGKLNSNGQVWLINPNGVLFGQGARVNVGGLLATTLNIADDDFMSGKYQFAGSNGSVVNMGSIKASQGGYVAMLAPEVRNEGVISAMQGTVAMHAGNAMTLDFNGSGLISVQVDSASVNTLVENKHLIKVGNGQVLMSTKAADGLITSVINNSGKIEANSMVSDGGTIRLTGAETVINSGEISATSSSQKGGTVHLLGENVGIFSAGTVNVSGKTGGGTILVGGDFQGKNASIQNAIKTFVSSDAKLVADATVSGDGGKVIVWADDITRYYGSTSAKGGAVEGNGGFVEISGKRLLNFSGGVDLSAANGIGGNLLLDPENITLSNVVDTNTAGFNPNIDITEAFADDLSLDSVFNVAAGGSFAGITAGSTITLQANNDITVSNAFDIAAATGTANNSLVLEANNNINVNAALSTTGSGVLTLRADKDGSDAGNLAINAAIATGIGGANLSGANVTSTVGGTIATVSTNQNGGNVIISSSAAINLAGSITTTGGAAATVGRNAGNVTLNAGTSVNTGAITANGSVGNVGGGQAGGNAGVIDITAKTGVTSSAAISASGGAASAGSAKGGDAGTVNISNLDAGNISGTIITAVNGNATGAGAGGLAGSINITNQANSGNVVFSSSLLTRGAFNGAGGNINVSSQADVNLAILNVNGGNGNTGYDGRNAGNITISGVNRTITGSINANGGAGVAGGNAGVVSITGTGTLGTDAINVRSGTGIGGKEGSINLSASSITTRAISTAPGPNSTNSLGGDVNLTTTGASSSSVLAIDASNFGDISINAADTFTVTATIAGAGTTLSKSGIGKLVLSSANTFTGAVNVNAGVLNLRNNTAAGTSAGGITVANGAALELEGGITVDEALTLNGTGVAGAGALRSVSGVNEWEGPITLASDAQINSDAGTLTISGNIGGAEQNLTVGGAGNSLINSVIGTTTGALSKAGAGSLTLGGINTYTGATNVNAGTLLISASERINNASAVTVASGATFNLNNLTETVGSIADAGNIVLGTGSLLAGADNTSTTFSGVISGEADGSFSKTGSGTLTLSGNNTYDGVTSVLDGTLSAAGSNALGTTTGATFVGCGKTLNVNNASLANETINLNSAAVLTGTGAASLSGNVITADNSQIGTTSSVSTLTIGGILSANPGNTLEIIGAGSVTAVNASNNIDIVKITSADNVSLRDIDSMRFSDTASNLTGSLTAIAANNITLQAGGGITATGDILLTSDAFINGFGANALTSTTGRWVVHTSSVAGNTYGSLASGNQAIYGRALRTPTAETGNRYVFSDSPTLNVISTNQSKTYGQDATAAVANAFTATTFVDAAASGGVFTQDTIANSLIGSATSVGSVTTANVNSYAIDVTPITSVNGYTLITKKTAKGTITEATLDLNAVADSKTYDGNTTSSATATATGLVGGDSVTELTQRFAEKNVLGTDGSTLEVNDGYTVKDGNGGKNYTITKKTAKGTITEATLDLNAVADSKTYDGNTTSSATATATGLVGGDSVTELTQRFAEKNVLGTDGSTLEVNDGYTVKDGNGGKNYTITKKTAKGTITPAVVNLVVGSRVYDGTTVFNADAFSTFATGVNGETLNVSGSGGSIASKNAGVAQTLTTGGLILADGSDLAGGLAANYTLDGGTHTATITAASLSITANNSTKFQRTANPLFTSTISGFVGGDTSAVLAGKLDYNTLADAASPVGTYTVTPFGVTASNYTISFVDGALNVTALSGDNISVFNNPTTRPQQALQTFSQQDTGKEINQQGTTKAMINWLDEFGIDDVNYLLPVVQPQVGGVIANGLWGVIKLNYND
ncbi:Filamentous haemagglutinin, N-terminal [Methylophilaceae bacterium]